MNIKIGNKIRALRKERNLSQETLAQYLGISFQSVSKWENGTALPDVTMIPAIASFFDVSTDELFDFNRLETEQKVQKQCWDIADWRRDDPERAEKAYRDLLKQYPGNEIILANLLYVLQKLEKNAELIELCKSVIASAKLEDIRYDAARIMAETYRKTGEYALCKNAIEQIPEFFFTNLEEKAILLKDEDMFHPAWQQKVLSLDSLVWMSVRLADYYEEKGDPDKAQKQLCLAKETILLFQDEDIPPFWKENYFMSDGRKWISKLDSRIENLRFRPDQRSDSEDYIFTRFS